MTGDSTDIFPFGSRVRTQGHWEWPDGTEGVVVPWPHAVQELVGSSADPSIPSDLARATRTQDGELNYTQWVAFDEPTDDGSGDGPYVGGEVEVACLVAVDDADQ